MEKIETHGWRKSRYRLVRRSRFSRPRALVFRTPEARLGCWRALLEPEQMPHPKKPRSHCATNRKSGLGSHKLPHARRSSLSGVVTRKTEGQNHDRTKNLTLTLSLSASRVAREPSRWITRGERNSVSNALAAHRGFSLVSPNIIRSKCFGLRTPNRLVLFVFYAKYIYLYILTSCVLFRCCSAVEGNAGRR